MSQGLSLNRSLLEHSPQFSSLSDPEKAIQLEMLAVEHSFAFQKYDSKKFLNRQCVKTMDC